jgi:hypothetical protein
MKLGVERLEAQESVLNCLQYENEWSTVLERCGGAFYNPQKNLVVGVSETQIYLDREANMSDQPL